MSTTERTAVTLYQAADRSPGSGPILAVLTDGFTDLAVAATAARLAADGRPVIVAAAVRGSGPSINALLHQARATRIAADVAAAAGRVSPILQRAGVMFQTTPLLLPVGWPDGPLPARSVRRLARRTRAATVVTAAPLTRPIPDWLTFAAPSIVDDHDGVALASRR
ncbi:hypothetical protein EV385_6689 [Krasilnikovia cinnamomea]|uniref:Universal stress protein family protein n=1 Tax=Krasilnikovia cinnamomea TaxID=349313 RepID=A0A4Q7Z980_9ACTN|nr:hypothetical protein [Krasilnikovia cinnamomea]RZU46614.1 hypothetical protein EV385_6689 [Krasilnikovia cinnamomea]